MAEFVDRDGDHVKSGATGGLTDVVPSEAEEKCPLAVALAWPVPVLIGAGGPVHVAVLERARYSGELWTKRRERAGPPVRVEREVDRPSPIEDGVQVNGCGCDRIAPAWPTVVPPGMRWGRSSATRYM